MIRAFISIALALALAPSSESVLKEYDLSARNAAQHDLPGSLREISGFATTPDGRLFGHDDENGVISEIDPATGAIRKSFRMGDPVVRDDFEGIAIGNGHFYLVTSAGVIYETTEGEAGASVAFQRIETGASQQCEVEGLAYDADRAELLLPCKTLRQESMKDRLVVLGYSLRERKGLNTRVSLPLYFLGKLGGTAHPASIEVHPRTGNRFVLSSHPQGILEISPSGELLDAVSLSAQVHPQPESIAFDSDLSIMVGDEGPRGPPRITIYRLTKKQ